MTFDAGMHSALLKEVDGAWVASSAAFAASGVRPTPSAALADLASYPIDDAVREYVSACGRRYAADCEVLAEIEQSKRDRRNTRARMRRRERSAENVFRLSEWKRR